MKIPSGCVDRGDRSSRHRGRVPGSRPAPIIASTSRWADAEQDGRVGDRVERFAVGVEARRRADRQMTPLGRSLGGDQPLPRHRMPALQHPLERLTIDNAVEAVERRPGPEPAARALRRVGEIGGHPRRPEDADRPGPSPRRRGSRRPLGRPLRRSGRVPRSGSRSASPATPPTRRRRTAASYGCTSDRRPNAGSYGPQVSRRETCKSPYAGEPGDRTRPERTSDVHTFRRRLPATTSAAPDSGDRRLPRRHRRPDRTYSSTSRTGLSGAARAAGAGGAGPGWTPHRLGSRSSRPCPRDSDTTGTGASNSGSP